MHYYIFVAVKLKVKAYFRGLSCIKGICLLSEGEFMQYKGRKYAWLDIDKNGVIKLPHSTLGGLRTTIWNGVAIYSQQ